MKSLALSIITALTLLSCSVDNSIKVQLYPVKVEAPFGMPEINVPDFNMCEKFVITDFGAVENNKDNTTLAIEKAIEKASENGGGIVIIPKGEWLTGTIHLKSNVNLHLEKDALLLFSENPADYLPAVHSTWEGLECYNYSPLIYAYKCKNIAITGEGGIKAKMNIWKIWSKRPKGHMNSIKML